MREKNRCISVVEGYYRLHSHAGNAEDVPPDQKKYEGDQGHKTPRTLPRHHSGKYSDIEI